MFNLEQSITEWRQQMLAGGIKTPVPLEELESHLREEFQEEVKSGVSKEQAFEISVKQIGSAAELKNEFKRLKEEKYNAMWYLRSGAIWLSVTVILNLIVVYVFHVHLKHFWEGAYGGGIYGTIFGLLKCAYRAKRPKNS
jgi:hypothetical protein